MTGRARAWTAVLAGAGLAAAAASTWVHVQLLLDPAHTSFCDISAGVSCSEVYQSRYGSVLGVPVALGGIIWFAGVLLLVLAGARGPREAAANVAGYLLVWSTLGLAVAMYMAYASFFVPPDGLRPLCRRLRRRHRDLHRLRQRIGHARAEAADRGARRPARAGAPAGGDRTVPGVRRRLARLVRLDRTACAAGPGGGRGGRRPGGRPAPGRHGGSAERVPALLGIAAARGPGAAAGRRRGGRAGRDRDRRQVQRLPVSGMRERAPGLRAGVRQVRVVSPGARAAGDARLSPRPGVQRAGPPRAALRGVRGGGRRPARGRDRR